MPENIVVSVPDIGDFEDVEVIEILVAHGDRVEIESPLVTLESDKASMDVPSPLAGVVVELRVAEGARVSQGSPLLTLRVEATAEAPAASAVAASQPLARGRAAAASPTPDPIAAHTIETDVAVLGAGPGGYSAAFRAADLGKRVVLVERHDTLGGVCLNVGCIPSKALLHVAQVMDEVRELAAHGVAYGEPKLDLVQLRGRTAAVVKRLTDGLEGLAKRRKVEVVRGEGRFVSPNRLIVEGPDGSTAVDFGHAVIAAGSRVVRLPGLPDDPRIMDSTDALALPDVPRRLLVIGGGIIGLELATVYAALGSAITIVELLPELMSGTDRDLVRPLQKRLESRYERILLRTRVTGIEAGADALRVRFEGDDAPPEAEFDRVLVAVGRAPNGGLIGAERAGVRVDERGFIPVDDQLRTNVSHIHAIGDVARPPLLAHKAVHEGKIAAEVIAGEKSSFDARAIPAVAYTDPEVAWAGLTETEAEARGVEVEKGLFPWAASGRALGIGRDEGLTKLLFSKETGRLVGAGIVGPHAGDLIAETVLALELDADAFDLGLAIHPHPTLSETVAFAAEMASGTITDLMPPRRKH
jgi:dihydrolipoamide dehydrogenase